MNDSVVLAVRNLTKLYKSVPAIDAVSFSVTQGEVVGFVGLNGAGKSTTINIILGFLRASSGSVKIFGQAIVPQNAHRSHYKTGFASGDMSLFANLSGKQYLSFISHRYGMKNQDRLRELTKRFEPQLDKKINDLSRGNKQKIALIAAFMASPELVILDEPSSGLDPLMQQLFVELIREETARGTTIFMSSHYLNEVVEVCSRILLIRDGKLIKDMPATQLISKGAKMVRIVSRHIVKPPGVAELVVQKRHKSGYELSFTYKADPSKLQNWLGGVPHLIDITIADHALEGAFEDLYALETSKAPHV
ncbi:ABC transporter ATP-binding protein [Candidatus Saccharibacteria bacterium]|nr:ABC transporter ATP-binding protein [Candidatus Saccharibacteria bacterium]